MKRHPRWIPLVLILAAGLAGVDCKKSTEGAAAKRGMDRSRISFPVEVQTVELRALVYTVSAVGSVDAFEKVQVTARVPGVVDRVLFTEGQFAEVADVLVEIEPERYRLAVEAAQAAFDKALASKADAEAGLRRRETVIAQNPGLIPGEELETWRTKVLVAASDVSQTKSALNQANLNLRDAYVKAPFSGVLQTRTVQTGQYVQTGTVLATLVRRDPLLLRFKVPERDAARFRTGMKAVFKVRDNERTYEARLVHIAASADDGTRLVDVTAEVAGGGNAALRPGSFAEITVPVSGEKTAAVIPQTAIRPSERGFLAFVVENDAAVQRILTLGMRTADGQVEVLSGLAPGELLVVRGAEALRDGAPVRAGGPAGPSPAAPPVKN